MGDHGPERQGVVGSRLFSFFHFFILPIDCFPGVIAKWVKHVISYSPTKFNIVFFHFGIYSLF